MTYPCLARTDQSEYNSNYDSDGIQDFDDRDCPKVLGSAVGGLVQKHFWQ
jgi:hypothetical protein